VTTDGTDDVARHDAGDAGPYGRAAPEISAEVLSLQSTISTRGTLAEVAERAAAHVERIEGERLQTA
jgi:hypothetical protein